MAAAAGGVAVRRVALAWASGRAAAAAAAATGPAPSAARAPRLVTALVPGGPTRRFSSSSNEDRKKAIRLVDEISRAVKDAPDEVGKKVQEMAKELSETLKKESDLADKVSEIYKAMKFNDSFAKNVYTAYGAVLMSLPAGIYIVHLETENSKANTKAEFKVVKKKLSRAFARIKALEGKDMDDDDEEEEEEEKEGEGWFSWVGKLLSRKEKVKKEEKEVLKKEEVKEEEKEVLKEEVKEEVKKEAKKE